MNEPASPKARMGSSGKLRFLRRALPLRLGEDNEFFAVLAELLFVYLPLVVLLLFHTYITWPNSPFEARVDHGPFSWSKTLNSLLKLVYAVSGLPEISFATSVLFGLSTVKCVMAATKAPNRQWEKFGAAVALLLVFGLVPTLTVLTFVLLSNHHPAVWLIVIQDFLFIFASYVFLRTGCLAHRHQSS
jgi:hypothetical protein